MADGDDRRPARGKLFTPTADPDRVSPNVGRPRPVVKDSVRGLLADDEKRVIADTTKDVVEKADKPGGMPIQEAAETAIGDVAEQTKAFDSDRDGGGAFGKVVEDSMATRSEPEQDAPNPNAKPGEPGFRWATYKPSGYGKGDEPTFEQYVAYGQFDGTPIQDHPWGSMEGLEDAYKLYINTIKQFEANGQWGLAELTRKQHGFTSVSGGGDLDTYPWLPGFKNTLGRPLSGGGGGGYYQADNPHPYDWKRGWRPFGATGGSGGSKGMGGVGTGSEGGATGSGNAGTSSGGGGNVGGVGGDGPSGE